MYYFSLKLKRFVDISVFNDDVFCYHIEKYLYTFTKIIILENKLPKQINILNSQIIYYSI